jgi:hypothetical protein
MVALLAAAVHHFMTESVIRFPNYPMMVWRMIPALVMGLLRWRRHCSRLHCCDTEVVGVEPVVRNAPFVFVPASVVMSFVLPRASISWRA